jgi:hypothetical protein
MGRAHIVRDAQTEGRAGRGDAAAPGLAGYLGLAAAPTFALMALWTSVLGGQPAVLCGGGSPVSGMTLMYLLMSVFHAGPWLQRRSR